MQGQLSDVLRGLASARSVAGPWLEQALTMKPFDRGAFLAAFAGAGRRLGRATAPLTEAEHAALCAVGLEALGDAVGADDWGRAALVAAAIAALPAAEHAAFVDQLYKKGEIRERQAVLRVLAALPDPARFVDTAVEACRSSVQTVFEAIACENPYPAAHFAEPSFNQMVLKALFTETAIDRIVGLSARVTPELSRMVHGYASERTAAGRSVSPDTLFLMTRGNHSP